MSSPTLQGVTLASPTLQGVTLASPTLQGVTLASPTLQGVTLASVPVKDPDKKMSVDNRTWFFRSFRLTVLSGIL